MSTENSVDHYAAVLAELEAQRARIDTAIAAIKALQSGGPIPVASLPPSNQPASNVGVQIELDAFHKLTLSHAIKKYLRMRPKRPATTAEIVDALKAGGQSGADGANFAVVVNNSLNRMSAEDGAVSKVRRGVWGLKEWYETKASGAG
jgi:hypothetical protein